MVTWGYRRDYSGDVVLNIHSILSRWGVYLSKEPEIGDNIIVVGRELRDVVVIDLPPNLAGDWVWAHFFDLDGASRGAGLVWKSHILHSKIKPAAK